MLHTVVKSASSSTTPTRWNVQSEQHWDYQLIWDDAFMTDPTALRRELDASGREQRRPIFIVDEVVYGAFRDELDEVFAQVEPCARVATIRGGEERKNLASVSFLIDTLDAIGVHRRKDVLVAIGGGVLSDLATFTASTYRRGMSCFRIPTTLLALVDAAVGVKTGVNHRDHKNRIGTYFASEATILCPEFLRTLPTRHVRNGVGEILKVAIGCDAGLFAILERGSLRNGCQQFVTHPDRDEICRRAITAMLAELEPNLWEKELRRAVDLGHTFSGKVELGSQGLLHGEVVAWETLLAAQFSANRGWLPVADLRRLFRLYSDAGLAVGVRSTPDELRDSLRDAVFHRNGAQHIPVPVGIGQVHFVEDSTIVEWVRAEGDLERMIRETRGASR